MSNQKKKEKENPTKKISAADDFTGTGKFYQLLNKLKPIFSNSSKNSTRREHSKNHFMRSTLP